MSGLTRSQMYDRYKQQEDWAKAFLAHAQFIVNNSYGPNLQRRLPEVRLLIEHTLIAAGEVRRLRREIQRFYPNDPGHDQALNWVHDHLIEPARQLGDRLGLPYDPNATQQCRPSHVSHQHRVRRNVDDFSLFADCEPARACFLNPVDKANAFIFANIGCVQIDVQPESTKDTIVSGPILIVDQWPCLQAASFFVVDAVLQNPDNSDEAYFFSGDKYALINIKKSLIKNGPHVTTTMWPSLNSAGFSFIDAVLPHPNASGQAYFFSGNMYALIEIKPGTTDDRIIRGPKYIANEWPSLRNAGFDTVDMALPNPSNKNEAYFFCGGKYARIDIKPESNNDTIVNGPKPVSENWPSLREALFY